MVKKQLNKKNIIRLEKNNFFRRLFENLSKKEKIFFILQFFIIAFLIGFIFIFPFQKELNSISGNVIYNDNFVFKMDTGDVVLLSNDINFENFITFDLDSYITLSPGKYYWKVKTDLRESEVKSFIIEELVSLEIIKNNGNYELRNSGNIALSVLEIDNESKEVVSSSLINSGEIIKINKNNSIYEGKINE